ncbi:MAG: hypothetical protein AAF740_14575, partial [Bacteroidota bacterium]
MVILESKPGQLANRTFYFAYFIANAIEYGYKLYNPHFEEYKTHFPKVNAGDFLGYSIFTSLPQNKVFRYLYPKFRWHLPLRDTRQRFHRVFDIQEYDQANREYDLNELDFVSAAQGKICWVSGWKFRDHNNLQKHHEAIREIFTPSASVLSAARGNVSKHRENASQKVIGVHIRRKDYRDF